MNIKRIINLLTHPLQLLEGVIRHCGFLFSDSMYLRIMYHLKMGKRLDLNSPTLFNEKLQWLKLYDRKPEYTTMVDKVSAKEYVASKIGKDYIVPTYLVCDSLETIRLEELPNQFVIKTNHGGGNCGVVICKDKDSFSLYSAKKKIAESMKSDIYKLFREWPYKNIHKRILIEKYLEDSKGDISDYKVHCFNGTPKFILVCRDRQNGALLEDFYTTEWKHMEVKRPTINNPGGCPCPECLSEMLKISKALSDGIPFLRCDFYIVSGKLFFSELTFFPASGFAKFDPDEYDFIFGSYLVLPNNNH